MFMRTRYWIFFCITLAFVGITLAWAVLIKPDNFAVNISIWSDIMTILISLGAASYAILQYLSIRRVERQKKSAEILHSYAKHLMHHVAVIYKMFKDDERIFAIINKIDRGEPLQFTRDELAKFPLSVNEQRSYENFLRLQVATMKTKQNKKPSENKDDTVLYVNFLPKDIVDNLPENYSLASYMTITLNDLEQLCMEIESGAADDSYLYGSLHQTFIPFVHSAAMLIQTLNIRSIDNENYYPYVSRLYRRWVTQENNNHKIIGRYQKKSEKRRIRKEKIL